MIAYNSTFINNIAVVKKAKQWFAQQLITAEQIKLANNKYHTDFYNPNLFIKIGLFIFTSFVILAALGLFALVCMPLYSYPNNSNVFAIITCIVFAISCIVALELLIKAKLLYRSGIDEALLYAGITFIYFAIKFSFDYSYDYDYSYPHKNYDLIILIIFLPFTIAAAIRYIDSLMSILAIVVLYVICFLSILKMGDVAKLIMPFALMLLSVLFYFIIINKQKQPALLAWKKCLVACQVVAMVVFYMACNYFIIRESSIEYFGLEIQPWEDIPLAWLFYLLTAIVPIAYIVYGLRKKNKVSLWVGLLFVALSALTFKYYFSLGHPEISLTIAGLLMIAIAYVSIRYLKTDKQGLTYKEEIDEDNFLKSNMEALAIVQSFTQQPNNAAKTEEFGGGEFGGAGSGGNF